VVNEPDKTSQPALHFANALFRSKNGVSSAPKDEKEHLLISQNRSQSQAKEHTRAARA
jgi:hypothetical protein